MSELPVGARAVVVTASNRAAAGVYEDRSGKLLADGLRALGARVTEVAAYRTAPAESSRERLISTLERRGVDVITLTSSSTVRNLVDGLGGRRDLLDGVAIACIGPVTAGTARELGLAVDVMADEHTIDGLVAALVGWADQRTASAGPSPLREMAS